VKETKKPCSPIVGFQARQILRNVGF